MLPFLVTSRRCSTPQEAPVVLRDSWGRLRGNRARRPHASVSRGAERGSRPPSRLVAPEHSARVGFGGRGAVVSLRLSLGLSARV